MSQDKGMTWSPVTEDQTLVEPVCQGSVLGLIDHRNPGDNQVLFSNPASVRRENLTIRMSTDECKSWPISKTLWLGPAAYSDLVTTQDGLAGCLFECGQKQPYETITFARFTLDWITNGTSQ